MFITPIQSIQPISDLNKTTQAVGSSNSLAFQDFLQGAMNNMNNINNVQSANQGINATAQAAGSGYALPSQASLQGINNNVQFADSGSNQIAPTADSGTVLPFQDLFQDAVKNVQDTNADMNNELYKLATGQSDDLHNLTIASQKATLSVQLLVQLRNKALDAYNEIMRVSV